MKVYPLVGGLFSGLKGRHFGLANDDGSELDQLLDEDCCVFVRSIGRLI